MHAGQHLQEDVRQGMVFDGDCGAAEAPEGEKSVCRNVIIDLTAELAMISPILSTNTELLGVAGEPLNLEK